MQNQMRKVPSLESAMAVFLATGNLPSPLNVQQDKGMIKKPFHKKETILIQFFIINVIDIIPGLTIVVENINRMRYMSHFRAVHRGSFFQEMRTTEARQLLPDAWGFICPVHTPDGTPCGLLNHLSKNCEVSDYIFQM